MNPLGKMPLLRVLLRRVQALSKEADCATSRDKDPSLSAISPSLGSRSFRFRRIVLLPSRRGAQSRLQIAMGQGTRRQLNTFVLAPDRLQRMPSVAPPPASPSLSLASVTLSRRRHPSGDPTTCDPSVLLSLSPSPSLQDLSQLSLSQQPTMARSRSP
jgi:hypothetical protein